MGAYIPDLREPRVPDDDVGAELVEEARVVRPDLDKTREVKKKKKEDLSGRRTSRYRRRPGSSSPSMPLLVFWPLAGAWGAGGFFRPALSFCGVSCMYERFKKRKKKREVRVRYVRGYVRKGRGSESPRVTIGRGS